MLQSLHDGAALEQLLQPCRGVDVPGGPLKGSIAKEEPMIGRFLSNCTCLLPEETDDFREVCNALAGKPMQVGFMPAITDDLYAVYALACTSAKKIVSPDIYIVPIGAYLEFAKPRFEEMVDRFYREDEFREQFGIDLEEMILLSSPEIDEFFLFEETTRYNVIFCRLSMPSGAEVQLVVVPETPEGCWKKIIEVHRIKCDVVVDSNKGMGNWFEEIPLYRAMKETDSPELLPRYYFKGMFISHDAPPGFRLICRIPDTILYQGRPVAGWQKKIYETDWKGTPDD